jgi:hypothetical protein
MADHHRHGHCLSLKFSFILGARRREELWLLQRITNECRLSTEYVLNNLMENPKEERKKEKFTRNEKEE